MDRLPLDRARACIGAPFRLNGCHPQTGFDCAGLVAYCWHIAPETLPIRRSMMRVAPAIWHDALSAASFVETRAPKDGDVLLLDCGRGRWHVGISDGDTVIHAHAGLGRVVRSPLGAMRVVSVWRKF